MTGWMQKRSLRVKAIAFVLVVITVGLLITGTATVIQTNSLIVGQQRQELNTLATSLARASELPLAVRDRAELARLLDRFAWDSYVLFTAVYDDQHELLASKVRDEETWARYQWEAVETKSMLLGTVQVELSRGADEFDVFGAVDNPSASEPAGSSAGAGDNRPQHNVVGQVVVALSAEPMHMAQRSQALTTLSMVVLAAVASAAVVFWTVTLWTKRLDNLVEASERIAQGDFTSVILDTHVDEIGRLSKAHEEMRKAVQQRTTELVDANRQIRQAQGELVQAEKMSMLGQLAAGVAHEINTPTGAIMNVSNDAGTHLKGLIASALRLSEMPRELLDWLAEVLPGILARDSVFPDLADRQSRQAIQRELRGKGISNPRRAADIILDCGLDCNDPNVIKCLSHELGMAFLEHVVALKVGSRISLVSVDKIAKIVRALRYYSRSGEGDLFDININESLDNTLVILQNRIKHIAKVERDYQADLPLTRCGPDVSQVWTNIISNACDAIEGGDETQGLIRVKTRSAGEWVVIEIFNAGPHVPEETMSRIFDPFFTTKPIGKGTRLGLGICVGILQKYKGSISARNDSDGVTFEVRLPLFRAAPDEAAPQADGRPGMLQPVG